MAERSAEEARAYRLKEPVKNLLRQVRSRCKRIGREFDLVEAGIEVPAMCPVLGMPLIWSGKITDNTPSLDRINNNRGYTHDNVQIISNKANRMKTDATPEELKAFARWVLENYP